MLNRLKTENPRFFCENSITLLERFHAWAAYLSEKCSMKMKTIREQL
jgi:hypothetical protein